MSVFQFSVQMPGSSSVFLLCPGVDNAVCANWAGSGLLMQNKIPLWQEVQKFGA